MTPQELADKLNGREWGAEITREEETAAKAAGLVVVFGASDDLMEFRGATTQVRYAYEGRKILIDAAGVLGDIEHIMRAGDVDAARDYFRRENARNTIIAIWDAGGYSWTYDTDIPHAEFDIFDGGEKYCRGIVFRLEDCK